MRNNFTKLFFIAAMMVCSLTAIADTAIVHSKIGVDGGDLNAANSWTGLSGSTAVGFTVDMPDNTSKTFSQAGWVTYNETNYKSIKNSNGQRIRIQLPLGKEAQSVTIYVYTNSENAATMKFNGVATDDVVPAESSNATPAVITKALENETSFDFTFSGAQICFIAVITYRDQPVIDPERVYTFGGTATLDGTNLSAFGVRASGNANIETTINATYGNLIDRFVYHGDATAYTAALPYRNMVGSTLVKTQDGAEDGAETLGAYIAFQMNIADGYKLSLTQIASDLYVDNKSNWKYEYVIENNSGVTIYKSSIQTIAAAQSGTDHSNAIALKADAVRNLTGTVIVKLIWWLPSNGTVLAPKDFNVTAVVHEIESQTKTLNRIDVNGVEYDYVNEGNTISTLLHAAPSVKFYYDVVNNWSDGSETAAEGEEETIIASVSGGNYVATTTLASTPYSLTFTNVDLPKVFGITRAVATELSNSTDMKDEAPLTQNKYAVSADALVDPSAAHVTMAMNYSTPRNALANQSRSFVWYNGSEVQDCFVDYGELSDRTSSNDFNENQYFGFDMTVDLGYKVSLTELVSDALIEKDKTGVHYLVKIYNNDVEVASMPDVEVTSKGINMKRVIDLSENAELQDLTGKITVKMFIYGNQGKYIIVKDLSVAAAVENNPGEGINTLSFVDFTPAKEPEFTNGEVTATWKMTENGGNIGPQTDNRGIRVQSGYGFQVTVSVPEDSYISEVVFVWNSKSARSNNAGQTFIDFTIKNNVGKTVSSLVVSGTKVDESSWTCGDVRESELTFAQGDGDFYLNSIRVTYLKKDADPDNSYTRTHAHMNLNTLCFPYTVTAYTGATFYTMLYKRVEGSTPVEVVLEEHEGDLVAGNPYFYIPEGSQLELTYSGERDDSPNTVNGVVGSYDANTAVPSGSYVTYNGEIRAVGSNVKLAEYRAYINMNAVSAETVAPAPGRRVLRIHNANAPAVATDVEDISNQQSAISQKVLRDGQLLIIRDGRTYNAQGQVVNR